MHEMSLLNSLMNKIESISRENGDARVTGVKLKVGVFAHISPEHLRHHFNVAAKGGVAEGAKLEVIENTDPDDENAQSILLESVDVE